MSYQIIIVLLFAIIIILINFFLYERNKYLQELLMANKEILDITNKYKKCLIELKLLHKELIENEEKMENNTIQNID